MKPTNRILATVVLAVLWAAPAAGTPGWSTWTVAPSGRHADLALDAMGRPHVIFDNCTVWENCEPEGPAALTYGVFENTSWTFETLAGDPGGFHSSIVVDGIGKPHIAYCDSNWRMHYGVKEAAGWTLEDLAHPEPRYYRASSGLALDGAGEPHVAFIERETIHYAHRVAGVWTDERVAGTWLDNWSARTAIAVDSMDSVRIGTLQYYSSAVYLTQRDTIWNMEFLDGARGYNPWMVLGPDDTPHMVYHGGGLFYATNASGSWVEEVVDAMAVNEANDVALDPQGRPVVVYTRATLVSVSPWLYDLELIYKRRMDSGWVGGIIDTEVGSTSTSMSPRLEIDQAGVLHVLYRRPITGELLYAEDAGLSAAPEMPRATSVGVIDRVAPNPFNPVTEVVFVLSQPAQVSLDVYDVGGRKVRTLVSGQREAGTFRASWDGRTAQGRGVSSGVYFFRLVADGHQDTRRAVLLK